MEWPKDAPPSLELTVGRALGSATTGNISYKSGEWALGSWGRDVVGEGEHHDAVEVSVTHKTGRHSVTTAVQVIFGIFDMKRSP
jgi:DnaJ family protein C protein 11